MIVKTRPRGEENKVMKGCDYYLGFHPDARWKGQFSVPLEGASLNFIKQNLESFGGKVGGFNPCII